MNSIAWAIVCAGLLMMHPRDRESKTFVANNAVDVMLFVFSFCVLLHFSFKS